MINEFENYKGVKILNYFLENPTLEIHIKELSRTLNISPSTSKTFCDLLKKRNILYSEKKGNALFFKLRNEENYVRLLKKEFIISKIKYNLKIPKDEGILTTAVYGSSSSGDYTEESDIDMIIITRKEIEKRFLLHLKKKLRKEIDATIINYIKWNKMKKEKDPFAIEILENNFIIEGEKL